MATRTDPLNCSLRPTRNLTLGLHSMLRLDLQQLAWAHLPEALINSKFNFNRNRNRNLDLNLTLTITIVLGSTLSLTLTLTLTVTLEDFF